ncbi:MAG TPA: SgcJ/EcaC family oxidoreductase [Candidatus Acidoferrales bacterium]|nr:SgcJ/EcaC family oxidoreductase [Candidatus Acidoferrales bacterium]
MHKPARLALGAFLFLAALAAGAAAAGQAARHEETEIRKLAAEWQSDWNRHDAKALTALLTDDADFVTAGGDWLQGRQAFHDWLGRGADSTFPTGVWTNNQVIIRFLMPDIAVVHITWEISKGEPGKRPPVRPGNGISTWVLIKAGKKWIIRSAQSTSTPMLTPR